MKKVELNIVGYVVLDANGANANPQGKVYASKRTAKNLLSKVETEAQAKAEAEVQAQAEREARYRAEAERILGGIEKYWTAKAKAEAAEAARLAKRERAMAISAKSEPIRRRKALKGWRG